MTFRNTHPGVAPAPLSPERKKRLESTAIALCWWEHTVYTESFIKAWVAEAASLIERGLAK